MHFSGYGGLGDLSPETNSSFDAPPCEESDSFFGF